MVNLREMQLFPTLIALVAIPLFAQDPDPAKKPPTIEAKPTAPRASPADYVSQGKAATVTIAAEFNGHAVTTPEGQYNDEDFVCVEVAVYGPDGARLTLSYSNFSLRINGKKPQEAQAYETIFHSLKDPEWLPPETVEKGGKTQIGSSGGSDINAPPPVTPKMPFQLQRAMEIRVQKAALTEGDLPLPQAGLLFFKYGGKVSSLHSLELVYSGPGGKATFALHP
jgi:hypothetical protein